MRAFSVCPLCASSLCVSALPIGRSQVRRDLKCARPARLKRRRRTVDCWQLIASPLRSRRQLSVRRPMGALLGVNSSVQPLLALQCSLLCASAFYSIASYLLRFISLCFFHPPITGRENLSSFSLFQAWPRGRKSMRPMERANKSDTETNKQAPLLVSSAILSLLLFVARWRQFSAASYRWLAARGCRCSKV